ncbi:hypothetical protein ET007_06555 [Lactococcus garvieae]|nr:hypothetical protein [Lactococcus garvieae]NHJ18969.1 hypothetical protein [Lactococcus garvieae]
MIKDILLFALLVVFFVLLLCIVFAFLKALYLFLFKKKFWTSFYKGLSSIIVDVILEVFNPFIWL